MYSSCRFVSFVCSNCDLGTFKSKQFVAKRTLEEWKAIFGTSKNTVKQTFQYLEHHGLIEGKHSSQSDSYSVWVTLPLPRKQQMLTLKEFKHVLLKKKQAEAKEAAARKSKASKRKVSNKNASKKKPNKKRKFVEEEERKREHEEERKREHEEEEDEDTEEEKMAHKSKTKDVRKR